MSVSKRTRFEILRRDNHTCQYCGQAAPDVVLHVDHVIPIALGGDDKPSNLVTACKDCNIGKTSISPDSPIVAAVAARSAEYAIANLNRGAYIEGELLAMEEYEEEFFAIWDTYHYNKDKKVPLPTDWRNSMKAWWKINVPPALIKSSIKTAMGAQNVTVADKFRYFAGVIWHTLNDFDARYPEQTNVGRVYSENEMDAQWDDGFDNAVFMQRRKIFTEDILMHHIDGTTNSWIDKLRVTQDG